MIGKRIKHFRQIKKMSMSELAGRANVAKSYISSIERDIQTNPSIQFLEKISEVLGISKYDLIDDKDADKPDDELMMNLRKAIQSGVSKEQIMEYLEFAMWKNRRK